jgi:hypothetical protein
MQRFDAVGRWLRDDLLPAPAFLLTGAGSHA